VSSAPLIRRRDPGELTAIVIDVVAAHYGVPAQKIYSRDQTPAVAFARQLSTTLVSQYASESMTAIAAHFRLDRATLRHSENRVRRAMEASATTRADVAAIRSRIEELAPELKDCSASLTELRRRQTACASSGQAVAGVELDTFLRDLRRSLVAAIRMDPGAVLAGIKRVADEINSNGAEG